MIAILNVVGESKIYYKKGSQGSLGARYLTKKFALVAEIIDTLQANSRIDWNILKHMMSNLFVLSL